MFCMKCGHNNSDQADYCVKCGFHLRAFAPQTSVPTNSIPTTAEDDPVLRALLPVGRSWLAVAAGYMGLFAILLVPAPLAILLGVLALRDIKRNPKKLGKGRAIFGIIMGALGTIGLAWVAVMLTTR